MIDLHAHSNMSDGLDSPTELVQNAAKAGVTTLAITDHDTTLGWDEAIIAGRQHQVRSNSWNRGVHEAADRR